MKCKKCGFTKRNGMQKTKCWTELNPPQCGKCARKDHPEIYNDNYRLTGRNPDYKPVCLKPEEHR